MSTKEGCTGDGKTPVFRRVLNCDTDVVFFYTVKKRVIAP